MADLFHQAADAFSNMDRLGDIAQWIVVALFACGFVMLWLIYWLGRRIEGVKYQPESVGILCLKHTWHAESGPCPYCLNTAAEAELAAACDQVLHGGSSSRGV